MNKIARLVRTLCVVLVFAVLVSGCANAYNIESCLPMKRPSGFWAGLWHGLIAGFAFIGSLFDEDIAVYDVNNTGGWYDFGFLLGVSALTGSSSTCSRCGRKN